jgi:Mg-chelatase subunit ChlD
MSRHPNAHICLVLDRSASMYAVLGDALALVNSYIAKAKRDRALYESRFTLLTFNSRGVDEVRKDQLMKTVRPLGSNEYLCGGSTPLYDAIGRGIGILDQALARKSGKAILAVVTDGLENCSGIRPRQDHVVDQGAARRVG